MNIGFTEKQVYEGGSMDDRSNSSYCPGQKGFTIIEIMIAIVILAIGLLSVASMQINAIKGNKFSDNITCALTLAEDKMEELLGLDYNNPELEDTVVGNNSDLSRIDPGWIDRQELNIDEAGRSNAGKFRRVWNIADNGPVENNKTITVIVTWDNDSHQVSLTSIKRR